MNQTPSPEELKQNLDATSALVDHLYAEIRASGLPLYVAPAVGMMLAARYWAEDIYANPHYLIGLPAKIQHFTRTLGNLVFAFYLGKKKTNVTTWVDFDKYAKEIEDEQSSKGDSGN